MKKAEEVKENKETEAVEKPEKTTWWVYIVRCNDDTLYTGISTDVERRVAEHSAGIGAKYTRSRRPVECVYREACENKSDALRRERAIKAMPRTAKLALIEH